MVFVGHSQNPIFLDKNGVTIKCHDWGKIGDKGELNGIALSFEQDNNMNNTRMDNLFTIFILIIKN